MRPNPRIPENVAVERDVVYGEAEGRPLKLDLVLPRPAPATPLPLIVFIHGGGWRSGDKAGSLGSLVPFVATGTTRRHDQLPAQRRSDLARPDP